MSPTTDKQNVHIQPIHSTFWEFRADNALLLKMKTFIDKNKSMKTRLQQLSCYVPFTVHKAHLLIFNKMQLSAKIHFSMVTLCTCFWQSESHPQPLLISAHSTKDKVHQSTFT